MSKKFEKRLELGDAVTLVGGAGFSKTLLSKSLALTSTVGLEKIDEMPIEARAYIQRIEELSETEVSIISTGPERNQTILINDPF